MAVQSELAGQPVIILKEGTTRSRGRDAQYSNLMASMIIAETVKSSLGPKGMDKMLVDSFGDVTITNDGATILDEMEIQHPVAKMMVEVAKAQDNEVGDGTTTVVVLAGELLQKAQDLINKDVHPTLILDGYRKATDKALEYLEKIGITVKPLDKETLKKVATTSLSGKVVAEEKEFLSDLAVKAVLQVAGESDGGYKVDIDDIKIQKKAGEAITDTKLIQGIVVDKEIVHPGMPKRVEKAKITLIDCALEMEKTEFTSKLDIENPDQMKAFLEEEEKILEDMANKVVKSGATVLFCQKGIDDLAQHHLARSGILSARRVKKSDMEKLSKATGGRVVTNIDDLTTKDLGFAMLVEERKIADEKWIFVEGCKNPKAVTLLIRGGTERTADEVERSIHDALMVVKDVVQEPKIVAGGGAPEEELAHRVRDWAQKLSGKEQLAAQAFAEALEVVPTALSENAGLDPIDILVELRAQHDNGKLWSGVNVLSGKVEDMNKLGVYEPMAVKKQILKSASEAAAMILKIDDVIASSKLRETKGPEKGPSGAEEEP